MRTRRAILGAAGFDRSRVRGAISAVALVTMIIAGLAGCSGPAEVSAPSPTGHTATICRQLVAGTPDVVDGQSRVDTDPASPYTTAWGDPPIALACGVHKPAGLNAASQCFEVNGVGWYAEDRNGGYRFTTIGRTAYVQVTVPDKYAPQANALVDLARPIKAHIAAIKKCV